MATLLDTSLLGHFQVIFPFLLILVLVYAILLNVKIFSGKTIPALIAVLIALMLSASTIARETIMLATPWFIVFFFFIIMTLIAYMTLGANASDIHGVLTGGKYRYISTWVIAIILIIMIGSLTSVVSRHGGVGKKLDTTGTASAGDTQQTNGTQLSNQESDFWKSLFNPKVLGLLFILLVSMFTIQRLAAD